MYRRKVTMEMICPMCCSDCETFPHLFLDCRFAQVVWRFLPIGLVPSMNEHGSTLAWFDSLLDRWKGSEEGSHTITLAVFIMWRLWKCRNNMVFNGVRTEPQEAILMAVKDATEFISVTAIEEVGMVRESTGRVEGPVRWIPPAHGGMKVNVDGAWVFWSTGGGIAGAGMVIRGSMGSFVAA